MTPARIFVASVAVVVLAGIVFIVAWDYGFISLHFQPRPLNVPSDAVEIPTIGKRWMYARCWSASQQYRCEVFDWDGKIVWNEVFLVDETGVPVSPEQLQIDPIRSEPRDFIGLKNGSYLLPSTDYAEHKRVLEAVQLLERANAEPVNAPK